MLRTLNPMLTIPQMVMYINHWLCFTLITLVFCEGNFVELLKIKLQKLEDRAAAE